MYNKQITISFTQELMDMYLKEYFLIHKKAKNNPLESNTPLLNLNKWVNLKRLAYNQLKQHWKDFVCYVVKYHGYSYAKINKCEIEIHITYPQNRAFDLMNFTNDKFILDGFTESGLIEDDNINVVQAINVTGKYEKGVSRLDYIIKY